MMHIYVRFSTRMSQLSKNCSLRINIFRSFKASQLIKLKFAFLLCADNPYLLLLETNFKEFAARLNRRHCSSYTSIKAIRVKSVYKDIWIVIGLTLFEGQVDGEPVMLTVEPSLAVQFETLQECETYLMRYLDDGYLLKKTATQLYAIDVRNYSETQLQCLNLWLPNE